MPERLDHALSIARCASRNKQLVRTAWDWRRWLFPATARDGGVEAQLIEDGLPVL